MIFQKMFFFNVTNKYLKKLCRFQTPFWGAAITAAADNFFILFFFISLSQTILITNIASFIGGF